MDHVKHTQSLIVFAVALEKRGPESPKATISAFRARIEVFAGRWEGQTVPGSAKSFSRNSESRLIRITKEPPFRSSLTHRLCGEGSSGFYRSKNQIRHHPEMIGRIRIPRLRIENPTRFDLPSGVDKHVIQTLQADPVELVRRSTR